MTILMIILILVILIGIYDLIRRVHIHLIQQTDELRSIREEISKNKNSQ